MADFGCFVGMVAGFIWPSPSAAIAKVGDAARFDLSSSDLEMEASGFVGDALVWNLEWVLVYRVAILYLLFCLRRRQSPQAIFFSVGGRRFYVEAAIFAFKLARVDFPHPALVTA